MVNWIDKLVLWRKGIAGEASFGDRRTIFQTKNCEKPVVLKFSYPGNVQYHVLTGSDVEQLSKQLNRFLSKGRIT